MFKWSLNVVLFTVTFISPFSDANNSIKKQEAHIIAQRVALNFNTLFERCVLASMPNQQFITDNVQNFINFPSKTTVGFAPKFTINRKFFANMLNTAAFKEMLANDEDELRRDMIKKMKYCDEAVMDKDLLKDFYDREVDQSKI